MPADFGPWASALSPRSPLELRAFWEQRVARLTSLAPCAAGVSRRATFVSVCGALALALAPIAAPGPLASVPLLAADDAAAEAPTAPPRPASEEAAGVATKLAQPVEVSFSETPVPFAIRYVSEYLDVPIRIDTQAIEARRDDPPSLRQRVHLNLSHVSFASVMKLILEPLALDWYFEEAGLTVTTREKAAMRLDDWIFDVRFILRHGVAADDLTKTLVSVVDPPTWQAAGGQGTLTIAKDQLHLRQTQSTRGRVGQLLIDIERALREAQGIEKLDQKLSLRAYDVRQLRPALLGPDGKELSDGPFMDLLRGSVAPVTWRAVGGEGLMSVEDGRLLVRQTPSVHAALAQYLALLQERAAGQSMDLLLAQQVIDLASAADIMRAALRRPQIAHFQNVPLADFLYALRDETGVRSLLAREALREAGIDPKVKVSIDAVGLPVSQILNRVLAPTGADWFVDDSGVVLVTSAARVVARRELHVYHVRELLTAERTGERLVEQITATIEPASWSAANGTAIHPLAGLLIVNHNRRLQDQVEAFLQRLAGAPTK